MVKQKKNDEATVQVSVAEFSRTRDQVLSTFNAMQNAIFEMSRAYQAHSNAVLGRPANAGPDAFTFTAPLADSTFRQPAGPIDLSATSPPSHDDGTGAAGEKKKKKKRYHDPDAPKRPLTPYFLYMQSARALIAEDLGPSVKPGEVSNEGTVRWVAMPDPEKNKWKALYAKNLLDYQARMAAYKASKGGDVADDPASAQLANEGGVDIVDAVAVVPPKAPTPPKEPKSNKRRKSTKADDVSKAKEVAPVAPVANMTKTPVPLPASTEQAKDKKKKKATPKKGKAAAAPAEPAPPAEKKSRKKRKSEAVES